MVFPHVPPYNTSFTSEKIEGTTMNLLYIQYLLRQGGTKVTSTFHTQLLMQTLP
jgi:hypothetical protein